MINIAELRATAATKAEANRKAGEEFRAAWDALERALKEHPAAAKYVRGYEFKTASGTDVKVAYATTYGGHLAVMCHTKIKTGAWSARAAQRVQLSLDEGIEFELAPKASEPA